jgi:UDP-3-O-[3-hydroxymyristoyl] N-acetylglucosamine deacetylase
LAPDQVPHQTTLARPVELAGVGLHRGREVRLEVRPALPGYGLRFVRVDLPGAPELPATVAGVHRSPLCTALRGGAGVEVATVEHLLAAARGLGLTDAELRLDGPEVPMGDGSAAVFADLLASGGLVSHGAETPLLDLARPVAVAHGEASLVALPAERPRFTYVFAHPHPAVGVQLAEFVPGRDDFRSELAPARTIGFLTDIERMRAQGLALGGSVECAVVIGEEGYVGPLRFPNEAARHKLLDLFGDLALIPPVRAHFLGLRSGHALNAALAEAILREAGA